MEIIYADTFFKRFKGLMGKKILNRDDGIYKPHRFKHPHHVHAI